MNRDAPLHLEGHPVDLAAQILTIAGLAYDAASAAATKAAVGPTVSLALRITSGTTVKDFLATLYGVFGFATRADATGTLQFFSTNPNLGAAYIIPNQTIANSAEKVAVREKLSVEGVPIRISGWSYALAELGPWSTEKLYELSIVMIIFNILLLIFLYRSAFPLMVLMASLFLSIGAMIACLKIFSIPLNLFNVLAFPLVLGVGVDYGIYVILALRQAGDRELNLSTILKPVLMSGLTTTAGFGSLGFAQNPSLSGLGTVCALGVAWSLFSTLFFILPAYLWKGIR